MIYCKFSEIQLKDAGIIQLSCFPDQFESQESSGCVYIKAQHIQTNKNYQWK